MATMVVLTFKDETSAEQMRDKLAGLQKLQLISLSDAAVVVRREDGKVKVPWLGLAIGAASGALGGALSDYGVDDKFIKEVGKKIEPGHSALFLLVESWTEDKVMDEIKGFDAEVLQTSLSKEDEAKLKAAFGAEE
jgi:uncharacterized membrane protein